MDLLCRFKASHDTVIIYVTQTQAPTDKKASYQLQMGVDSASLIWTRNSFDIWKSSGFSQRVQIKWNFHWRHKPEVSLCKLLFLYFIMYDNYKRKNDRACIKTIKLISTTIHDSVTRLKMLNRRENKYKSKKSSSNDQLSAFYKIMLKWKTDRFSLFFLSWIQFTVCSTVGGVHFLFLRNFRTSSKVYFF